ncbi:hypothetical protein WG922_14060 [Ramlibacter sp. AN1015]|uniref:hypothetical protein n=1 Tax=Ramlibacter sp. AN1015 TaxID=3133428 RepID=UPI0030C33D13
MAHPDENRRTVDDATPAGTLVPSRTRWGAAALAGLVAGAVALVLEMLLLGFVYGISFWSPLHANAVIVMGPGALPAASPTTGTIVIVGAAIQLALSALYGLLIGWLVHRMDLGPALLVGLAVGVALYALQFYLIAPAMLPWFVGLRTWVMAIGFMVFGLLTAGLYIGMRGRRVPRARVG